jgi:type IV secretory pathway component VirB8
LSSWSALLLKNEILWKTAYGVANNMAEAIDQTNSSDVLKYRILLFIAFGIIALVPVGILVTLTPIIIVTIRRGIRKRQQLTKCD